MIETRTSGCCISRKYRLRCVHSKGVLLLMAWTFFWNCSNFFSTATSNSINDYRAGIFIYALYLFFPFLGWIADSWLGRYKVLAASFYVAMLGWILQAVGYALPETSSSAKILTMYCGLAINYICDAGFIANILPFILDQLVGASGEELSAVVHWWYWTLQLSYSVTLPLAVFKITALNLVLTLLCLLFLIVTHLILRGCLVRRPLITNPIRHIAKVLNYARKNKYPRNRSALTYWEEDYPSRLDLGKDKYGGPFSEEEVEDVKTVLRLLPLLVCMVTLGLYNNVDLLRHYTPTSLPSFDYLTSLGNPSFWPCLVLVLLIPFYQLVVYPCFYKHVPSMLRRMSTGLLMITLAQCCYIILELVGHRMDDNVGCIFTSSKNNSYNQSITVPISDEHFNQSLAMPISYAFTIIPQLLSGLGELLLLLTSLEFIVAQSPARMRSMMIGLRYAVIGIANLLGLNLYIPFSYIPSSYFPSCGFYYFLTTVVICSLLLFIFLFLSKRYILRERNIPVNFHMFAENYYDKYIDIESQIEEERAQGREELYGSCMSESKHVLYISSLQ